MYKILLWQQPEGWTVRGLCRSRYQAVYMALDLTEDGPDLARVIGPDGRPVCCLLNCRLQPKPSPVEKTDVPTT